MREVRPVPSLRWNRRENVAVLRVSFARRIWDVVEAGNLVLGRSAAGRLAQIVFLDPNAALPRGARVADAARAALRALAESPHLRPGDVEILLAITRRIR